MQDPNSYEFASTFEQEETNCKAAHENEIMEGHNSTGNITDLARQIFNLACNIT